MGGDFVVIKTDRLIIREFEESEKDMNGVFSIFSDETVNKYLPWYPLKNYQEAKEFYRKNILPKYKESNSYYFAVCMKENNRPVGYITVNGDDGHDFGYGLQKEYWGKGIISEAVEAVLSFLSTTDIGFVTATHDVNNIGSGKVMEKNGMTYHYSYVEQWQPKDIEVTFRMYQLNFDSRVETYMGYWNKYPNHFIEDLMVD